MSSLKQVTDASFEADVLQSSVPVLVDFWAQWCAPCKVLMPVLEKITQSYQGELLLAKVDCDLEQDIDGRLGVKSLPTVVLFKDGKPVDNRTPEQKDALTLLLHKLKQMFPEAKIMGHRDIWGTDKSKWKKMCPCFNAIEEYKDIAS